MTTALKHGDTICVNGVYGFVGVEPDVEKGLRLGLDPLWTFQPGVPLPIYDIRVVKGKLEKENALMLVDRQLVLVKGRFFRIYFQRGEISDFVYFDHVLPHIKLESKDE